MSDELSTVEAAAPEATDPVVATVATPEPPPPPRAPLPEAPQESRIATSVDPDSARPPVYPAVDQPEAYDHPDSLRDDIKAGLSQLKSSSAASVPGTYIHAAITHFESVIKKLEASFRGPEKEDEVD